MLTALDTFNDKEKGFTSGADDYLVKPVDMNELVLRVKALLRRYKIVSENKYEYKSIKIDYQKQMLEIDNEIIELTTKEFQLLYKLISSPNRIFTREQLMNEIWGFDSESYERTVDTHIKRLREKLITNDFEIITVRGLGYKVVLK
jgi:DNA-binding response OmpR family regulator